MSRQEATKLGHSPFRYLFKVMSPDLENRTKNSGTLGKLGFQINSK